MPPSNTGNFITAGGQVVALVRQAGSGGPLVVRYLHRDPLGSTAAVTDESGTVVERLYYEPFGKRRFTNGADRRFSTAVEEPLILKFRGPCPSMRGAMAGEPRPYWLPGRLATH